MQQAKYGRNNSKPVLHYDGLFAHGYIEYTDEEIKAEVVTQPRLRPIIAFILLLSSSPHRILTPPSGQADKQAKIKAEKEKNRERDAEWERVENDPRNFVFPHLDQALAAAGISASPTPGPNNTPSAHGPG